MKLKQHEVNELYITLTTLSGCKLPFKTAFSINKALNTLEEQFKFGLKEEGKIYELYNAEPQANGLIKFANDTDDKRKKAFTDEMNELYNFEIPDIDLPEIELKEEDLSEVKMSPKDIRILSKIIAFEENM